MVIVVTIVSLMSVTTQSGAGLVQERTADAAMALQGKNSPSSSSSSSSLPNATTTTIEQLPTSWIKSYVDFQNQWVLAEANSSALNKEATKYALRQSQNGNGRQHDGRPPILVWNCPSQGTCGGLGDRLYGIVMGFYVAMLTKRIYLVQEWKSPDVTHPLYDYLEPHYLHWQVENLPSSIVDKMGMLSTVDNRQHPLLLDPCGLQADKRDYFFRNNIMIYESALRESSCLQEYWQTTLGDKVEKDTRPLSHIGFWTLFRFSPRVQEQARQILHKSGLLVTTETATVYIAMHVRTGQGKTWDDPDRHAGIENLDLFDQCAVRLRAAVMDRCHGGHVPIYVAADNADAKAFFLNKHSHDDNGAFKAAVHMEVFHVDRTKTELLHNVQRAYDVVWGELKILVDATCLVMSRSKFSTLGLELSWQQPRCAVYFDECSAEHVQQAVRNVHC